MSKIEENYHLKCNTRSDINEHLPTLKEYTEKCDTVVEMGVRQVVSTWAFLAGNPKKLISIDLAHPDKHSSTLDGVYEAINGTDISFIFREENTLTNEIEKCDFLFIDTEHTYDQLIQELRRHGNKAQKYLAFHDTQTFGTTGEFGKRGLNLAISEFMEENPHWVIEKVFTNNNGLTILRREDEGI